MLDFEVRCCTRSCAQTGRRLKPGEAYFSVLLDEEGEVVRRDVSGTAWEGPPELNLGWWRSRLADPKSGKARLAPGEVLLGLLERWADDPTQAEARYVLALLLVRRRVLRIEKGGFVAGLQGTQPVNAGQLSLYCPQNDKTYDVVQAEPAPERIATIQSRLGELLYADAA